MKALKIVGTIGRFALASVLIVAKSYRTEVNSLLRPTQWQDLLVRVYV